MMIAVFSVTCFAAGNKPNYRLLKTHKLGGGDGKTEYWDYITLDESTRRLFLSHGTEVKVVEADTGKVVGNIDGLNRAHGVALVKELGRGFISNGGANEVVIFDINTLQVLGHVATGGNPDCIIYDPASRRIFTMNGNSKDASAIDPAKGTVVGTVAMGGRPEYAVADGKGAIFDNIEDTGEVAKLDSRTLSVQARWPAAPAANITAIAMDTKHRRLFLGGRNKVLAIMDADNGKMIQTFPIGDGVDATIYDAKTGLVFSSMRDGTLYIFHEDTPNKFSLVQTVKTEYGARNMALDPKTHQLYLDTADFGPAPAPTMQQPHPQPTPVPGTFRLLVYGP